MSTRNWIYGLAASACLAAPLAQAGGPAHGPAWGPQPAHRAPGPVALRVRVVDVDPVVRRVRHEVPVTRCHNGRCRVHHEVRHDRRIVGYRVAWRHMGQRGVVQMPYRPGPYITVSFGVPGR